MWYTCNKNWLHVSWRQHFWSHIWSQCLIQSLVSIRISRVTKIPTTATNVSNYKWSGTMIVDWWATHVVDCNSEAWSHRTWSSLPHSSCLFDIKLDADSTHYQAVFISRNYISIFYYFMTLRWYMPLKTLLRVDQDLCIPHDEYHGCSCSCVKKEPGHLQPGYWSDSPELFQPHHRRGQGWGTRTCKSGTHPSPRSGQHMGPKKRDLTNLASPL